MALCVVWVGGGGARVGEVARSVTWCLCDCVHVCVLALQLAKIRNPTLSICMLVVGCAGVGGVCVCVTPVFV